MRAFMTSHRPLPKTLAALALAALVPTAAAAQESAQQRFEAGQYVAVLARVAEERAAGQDALESTFLAAQAAHRLHDTGRTIEEYERIAASPNPAWAALGRAGAALERDDVDAAQAAATEAVQLEAGLGFAHYTLGLVYARRGSHEAAAQSFARAAERMPSFAYAHYYAGLSFQRVRNLNRTASHFEQFLQLAPEAPERAAVLAVLRSIRG